MREHKVKCHYYIVDRQKLKKYCFKKCFKTHVRAHSLLCMIFSGWCERRRKKVCWQNASCIMKYSGPSNSFFRSAKSFLQKVCPKTISSGNQYFVMSQRALIPLPRLVTAPAARCCLFWPLLQIGQKSRGLILMFLGRGMVWINRSHKAEPCDENICL